MKNLNEINLYISMSDYEKTLDLIDQGITNLARLSQITMRLEGIQSLSVFPEVTLFRGLNCSTNRIHWSMSCCSCFQQFFRI